MVKITLPKPSLAALRQRIAMIDAAPRRTAAGRFGLGVDVVDARLGGGLERAAVHEIFAEQPGDAGAAAAFALILALCGGDRTKPIIWVRDDRAQHAIGGLHGLGLCELGADPARFIVVNAPDERAALRAAADSVTCGAVGAVVIEPYGKARLLDLTATRRLALASAASGVLTLLLRVDAAPTASAAQTRWQVAAAPSRALDANAPGALAFTIALLRHRGGVAGFEACLEWNREQTICALQPSVKPLLSGGLSAAAIFGSDHARAA